MRKTGLALLLTAAACGQGDNSIIGGFPATTITPLIEFDDIRSVISSRVRLFAADGSPTGVSSEVIIMSDQSQLCDRLTQHRDYFRNPPETYLALILFLPSDDRLGTFLPGRPGDEGTDSEIIGVKTPLQSVTPFRAALRQDTFISLREWSDTAGGAATGRFELIYVPAPETNLTNAAILAGRFKSSVCTTLDGTLLP
jgi:hypothetical protein